MSKLPSDTLLGDIETLFGAVSARLRRIADSSREPSAAPDAETIAHLRAASCPQLSPNCQVGKIATRTGSTY